MTTAMASLQVSNSDVEMLTLGASVFVTRRQAIDESMGGLARMTRVELTALMQDRNIVVEPGMKKKHMLEKLYAYDPDKRVERMRTPTQQTKMSRQEVLAETKAKVKRKSKARAKTRAASSTEEPLSVWNPLEKTTETGRTSDSEEERFQHGWDAEDAKDEDSNGSVISSDELVEAEDSDKHVVKEAETLSRMQALGVRTT
jgi:hypothetical protein